MEQNHGIFRQQTWRLIVDSPRCGSANMAMDEALARSAGSTGVPVLRLYRFDPAAITIGRNQRLEDFDLDACASEGIDIVRRPTGGLAILHLDDFTYSVSIPCERISPDARKIIFTRVATAILSSLRALGIKAEVVTREGRGQEKGSWCFKGVFGVDLSWGDRKICGSAQRVFSRSVLQHGSLFLKHHRRLLSRLSPSTGDSDDDALVTVSQAGQHPLGWEELMKTFPVGFERSLNAELIPDEPSWLEVSLADKLKRDKYDSTQWLLFGMQ